MTVYYGTYGVDVITGTIDADFFYMTRYDDGPGADTVSGDAGDDTFSYAFRDTSLTKKPIAMISGGAGMDTLLLWDTSASTTVQDMTSCTLKSIEKIKLQITYAAAAQVTFNASQFGSALIPWTATISCPSHVGFVNILGAAGQSNTINASGFTLEGQVRFNLFGSGLADTLTGGAYDDMLIGDAGNDTLNGGGGDDNLTGGAGDDVLNGGAGYDWARYDAATSGVTVNLSIVTAQATGGAGKDTLTGIEALFGSAYGDVLHGDAGRNTLSGYDGDDWLTGGGGDDDLYGGAGVDTAAYNDAPAGVTVNLTLALQQTGGAGLDYLNSIENVWGSDFDDTLTGDGGANVLSGNAGDDVLEGGAGDDTLYGGNGVDTASYRGATSGVTVDLARTTPQGTGGAGVDTLATIENLTGSAFGDSLLGDDGANVLTGEGGDDWLDGRGGDDSLIGGAGVDTAAYNAAAAGVTVSLAITSAQDTKGAGVDTLSGVENLFGSSFDDRLTGDGGANWLVGNAGDDWLSGGGGNDRLDGGAGDDVAVFNFSAGVASYSLGSAGHVTIAGPGSVADIVNVEWFRFSDGLIHRFAAPLVDGLYYDFTYRDVYAAKIDPAAHYNASGWREGRNPNAFFDTVGYLNMNPEVKAAGVNPLTHYLAYGVAEGRDPGVAFDNEAYLARNPDVKAAGLNPLAHFLANGQAEGRSYAPMVGAVNGAGFDPRYYLARYADVAVSGVDPYQHFVQSGWREGRDPNAYFDTSDYLARYADVAAAGVDPFQHYMQSGWHEGRDPSAAFDTSHYLAAYADVAAAGINPLMHYLAGGAAEGRFNFSVAPTP